MHQRRINALSYIGSLWPRAWTGHLAHPQTRLRQCTSQYIRQCTALVQPNRLEVAREVVSSRYSPCRHLQCDTMGVITPYSENRAASTIFAFEVNSCILCKSSLYIGAMTMGQERCWGACNCFASRASSKSRVYIPWWLVARWTIAERWKPINYCAALISLFYLDRSGGVRFRICTNAQMYTRR